MTAAVAVELPPADIASPHVNALLESCGMAMRSKATCVLSQTLSAGDKSSAVAIVAWDGAGRLEARIEVGLRAGQSARWQSRELFFSARDPEVERWRTVGFAIATLVGDLIGGNGGEPNEATPRPASPSSSMTASGEVPATREAAPLAPWWVDGQFLMETRVEGRFPAPGAQLRVSRLLGGAGPWLLASSARVTVEGFDAGGAHLSLASPAVSVGVGMAQPLGRHASFALRLEPFAELAAVTAKDSATAGSDQGAHFLFGVKEAIDAAWMWSRTVGIAVGVEMNEEPGATDIRVRDQIVARIPPVGFGFEGGIRLALP